MQTVFNLLQYLAAFFLGVTITVMLSGARIKSRQIWRLALICGLLLLGQLLLLEAFGLDFTKKAYPLIVHLPLWALLVWLLKTPGLRTAVAVLMAYLCCQVPRWVASLGLLLPEVHWLYPLIYLPVAVGFLAVMGRYLVRPICRILERSRWDCLLLAMVPALYYAFDYVTTVYTDLLFSGNMAAVQFMPSVVCVVYLLFAVLYHAEREKQQRMQQARDLLALQLNQARISLSAMRKNQEETRQYRHDMRHHFTLLQAMAAEKDIEKISQYLRTVCQDIKAMTPACYCGNDVVDLILSYYAIAADRQGVDLSVTAALPQKLPCSDTELCSLLSNSLENAIKAAAAVVLPGERSVAIHMGLQNGNLLIQIRNTYAGNLRWQEGLPCTDKDEHGLGTRSIRTIVRAHGGEAIFRAQEGWFQLRMLIPDVPAEK